MGKVIVKILGGFASQLGKYSLGYEIAKKRNDKLVLDLSDYIQGYFRPFMLSYTNIDDCEIINGVEEKNAVVVRTGKQLIDAYEDPKSVIYICAEENDYEEFFERYPEFRIGPHFDIFLTLSLKQDSKYIEEFDHEIEGEYSVAIHVRRGDFVTLGWEDDSNLYKMIIGDIIRKRSNAHFYFFSNDIDWVRKEYGESERFHFMENHNGDVGDLEQFFCLSKCNMKILSSMSGYSRYASYLGLSKYSYDDIFCITNKLIVDKCIKKYEVEDEKKAYQSFQTLVSIREEDYKPKEILVKNNQEIKYDFIIISHELFDAWRMNGMLDVAKKMADSGRNILYINTSYGTEYKTIGPDVKAFKNMDGVELGFDAVRIYGKVFDCDKLGSSQVYIDSDTIIISDEPIKCKQKYVLLYNKDKNIKEKIKHTVKLILTYFSKHKTIYINGNQDLNINYLSEVNTPEDLLSLIQKRTEEIIKKVL